MSKKDKILLEILRSQSEERKDTTQIEKIKESYIQEIKKIKKEELFTLPKKLTLWQKIKILILGN